VALDAMRSPCPHCGSTVFYKAPDPYVLAKVVQDEVGNISFKGSAGIPVVVVACDACGHIQLFSAVKTGDWNIGVELPVVT